MKKILKIAGLILVSLLGLILLIYLGFSISNSLSNSKAEDQLVEKPVLNSNGVTYKDLNANGKLDIYEDARQSVEARTEDLLKQMTLAEKSGLMWHPPIGMGEDGEVLQSPSPSALFFGSSYDLLINQKIRHFNLFKIASPKAHATWYNALQKIAEQDRLGIPVTISSDPRHSAGNFLEGGMLDSEFSKWPEPIGMAAIGDSLTMVEFGRIANAEYNAVGIRTALHPMADLATEPRWARTNGTFGEDGDLAAKMLAAYIYGFQGDSLNPGSIACMTKHWPGGGPQKDGEDAHFLYGKDQVYPGNNFDYHMKVFDAAFEANTAMIMPYYGVPNDQEGMEEVGFNFNKDVVTDLLRKQAGYDGIVCTDWGILKDMGVPGVMTIAAKNYGVENLELSDRILKAINAGVDQFGGDNMPEILISLVEEGKITESRIDESVRRLLRAKFQMGLFDNPYVDVVKVNEIVGSSSFVDKGKMAQRRSMVLLKNDTTADGAAFLPLAEKTKVYVENFSLEAVAEYGEVVKTPAESDIAILHLTTPWEPRDGDFLESMFHQGTLAYSDEERQRILAIMEQVPTIVVMEVDRPPVFPEINAAARGVLVEFGLQEDAVLDVVFGRYGPEGKLPIEFPSSMEAVKAQMEDMPYDSEAPLYPFGAGLRYGE